MTNAKLKAFYHGTSTEVRSTYPLLCEHIVSDFLGFQRQAA
jgi:hypothetical protein